MEIGKLDNFAAYRRALQLFEDVVADMDLLRGQAILQRLVGQQIASADSVCANIEEGYGRESPAEYRRHLVIARGSLRETQGRYRRLKHWIPVETIESRVREAEEISRMLTATIAKLHSS